MDELIRSQRGPTLRADSVAGSSMVTYDDVYLAVFKVGCLLRESSGKLCALPTLASLCSTKVNAVPPS